MLAPQQHEKSTAKTVENRKSQKHSASGNKTTHGKDKDRLSLPLEYASSRVVISKLEISRVLTALFFAAKGQHMQPSLNYYYFH